MMEKKRSVGVTVFGILLILLPLSYYLQIVIVFLNKSISLTLLPKYIIQKNFLLPLMHLVVIFCGIGILQLKEWARKLITYISLAGFVAGIGILILLAPFSLIFKFQVIIFNGLLYWFFTRPKVKEQFQKQ